MADDRFRALVLEDDPASASFLRASLERHGGMQVDLAGDADEAVALLRSREYDVLVSDVRLPGRSGVQALPEFRRIDPALAVLIVTAYPTVDTAVAALRESADDFLTKPVGVDLLVTRATQLAQLTRSRRGPNRLRVLAVGAHPDDVELGVGATLAAHAAAGDELTILILSSGAVGGQVAERRAEAERAAAIIGARVVHQAFRDTHMVPADGLITAVEEVVAEVEPDQIYTHGSHDRHQDHRATHDAVEIAARRVPNVWCFQSPSSTIEFTPNRFVVVDGFVDTKLKMLAAFTSQAHRDYMQPDFVRATARYWSRFSTAREVEPLETLRATQTVAASPRVRAEPRTESHAEAHEDAHGPEERGATAVAGPETPR